MPAYTTDVALPFCVKLVTGFSGSRGAGQFVPVSEVFEYDEDSAPSYPAPATLHELFGWFWRVKRWQVNYTVELDFHYDNGLGYEADISLSVSGSVELEWTDLFTRDNELHLRCWASTDTTRRPTFSGTATHADAATITESGEDPFTADVRVQGYLRIFQAVGAIEADAARQNGGGEHFPQLDAAFVVRVLTPDFPGSGAVVLNTCTLEDEGYLDIDWDFNGGTFPAQLQCGDSAPTCHLTLEPLEWWPWDPGDGGGPIWNASTGAPLRDTRAAQ